MSAGGVLTSVLARVSPADCDLDPKLNNLPRDIDLDRNLDGFSNCSARVVPPVLGTSAGARCSVAAGLLEPWVVVVMSYTAFSNF